MPLRRMLHQEKTDRLLSDGRKLFYLFLVFSYCGTVDFTFHTAPGVLDVCLFLSSCKYDISDELCEVSSTLFANSIAEVPTPLSLYPAYSNLY